MARLLYVALTRARDHLFFVESVQAKARRGGQHLKALLYRAEGLNPEAFEKLLPGKSLLPVPGPARPLPHEIAADPKPQPIPTLRHLDFTESSPRRFAISEVDVPRVLPIPALPQAHRLSVPPALKSEEDGADFRGAARRWGNLSHTFFAYMAQMEAPALWRGAALAQHADAFFRINAPAASGFGDVAASREVLVERAGTTLSTQLAPLLTEGQGLSVELPLFWSPHDKLALEGQADLVVWQKDRPLVVELKTSDGEYRAAGSWLQAALYAAALAHHLERPTAYAVWHLGNPEKEEQVDLEPSHLQALSNLLAQVDPPIGRG
jgi:ATP-dependent exoDNAse (exonuclease V) beta subunit